MTREQLFRFFFIAVFLFILFQILHILSPFYTGILGAIVLTLLFFPLHQLVLRATGRERPNLAAAISTGLVFLLIILPFIFCSWLLYNEMKSIYPLILKVSGALGSWRQGEAFTGSDWLRVIETRLQDFFGILQVNLQEVVIGASDFILNSAFNIGKKLPRNAFFFAFNMLVMIFTLFFLFRDGPHMLKRAKELVPMDDKYKDHIATQLYLTLTAVVRGVFLVALVQGTFAVVGFFIAGVPSPVLLGFATIMAALIPFVGAVAVWLPVGIYHLAEGMIGKGVFILIWGFFVVSLVDNFLRPILIGSRAKLPILLLFFGILGGLNVYGPMGLFLGPLVVALMLAFIRIYKEEYSGFSKPPAQGN